jgi:O-antigen/teichoic acid export membrane protein
LTSVIRTLGISASARLLTLPVTASATVVTTYFLVKELGVESYAYVVLVGSLFQLVPFADLGLGAVVVNASAKRLESRQHSAAALATARTAFRTLAISAAVLIGLSVLLGVSGAWPGLLGLPSNFAKSSEWAIATVLLPFALSIPFGIGQRVLIGEGRNHLVNYIGMLGPLVATATTLLLLKIHAPTLVLGMATPTGILVVSVICFVLALRTSQWHMRDLIKKPRTQQRPRLWNSAIPMLIISITVPLAMQSDRLVLSHFAPAVELSEYSVAAQMYVPCFSVVSMAAVSLWPIFTRTGSASFALWSKALKILAVGGLFLGAAFVVLVGPASRLITEDKLRVGIDLASAFATLLVVMACHQASAVLLTSPRHLAFQAVCSTTMLLVNLALSVYLAPVLGASGTVWASVTAVFVAQLVPCWVKARGFMKSTSEPLRAEPVATH